MHFELEDFTNCKKVQYFSDSDILDTFSTECI